MEVLRLPLLCETFTVRSSECHRGYETADFAVASHPPHGENCLFGRFGLEYTKENVLCPFVFIRNCCLCFFIAHHFSVNNIQDDTQFDFVRLFLHRESICFVCLSYYFHQLKHFPNVSFLSAYLFLSQQSHLSLSNLHFPPLLYLSSALFAPSHLFIISIPSSFPRACIPLQHLLIHSTPSNFPIKTFLTIKTFPFPFHSD